MDKLSPVSVELERICSECIKMFNLKAPMPIITIQTRGRKSALGWYGHQYWKNSQPDNLSEINICAENIADNPIATLIHELVHFANAYNGIKDCSSAQYHNKRFLLTAESFGLSVEKTEKHGYSSTKIPETLQTKIDTTIKPDYELFQLCREIFSKKKKAPTKMKKYSCGCTIVRCATELIADCQVCGNPFIQEQ